MITWIQFSLGDPPVSEFYAPTFRNALLFHLRRRCNQESANRKNTAFRTRRKLEIKMVTCKFVFQHCGVGYILIKQLQNSMM